MGYNDENSDGFVDRKTRSNTGHDMTHDCKYEEIMPDDFFNKESYSCSYCGKAFTIEQVDNGYHIFEAPTTIDAVAKQ